MALIHAATLTPSKLELLAAWVPTRSWAGDASGLDVVGAFRFDDPDGEVGVETHLLRTTDGRLLQVPVTYRAAALPDADAALVGTTQHSVLGPRWVYDACADPVYARTLAATVLTGGTEAPLDYATSDGGTERRGTPTHVHGSGTVGAEVPTIETVSAIDGARATVVHAGGLELTILRVVDGDAVADGAGLTGTWPGQPEPAVLVTLTQL